MRILAEADTTMNGLDEINRAVNRALRALNEVAVSIGSSSLSDRNVALGEITEALAHVDKLQALLYSFDPSLEYHYEPNRPPTRTMKEISDLVEAGERHAQAGNVTAAIEAFERARDLEPPPLPYEMIEKRLSSLRRPK
jgi:hypothetical protein